MLLRPPHTPPSSAPADILILAGDLSEGRPSQILSRLSELASCCDRYSNIIAVDSNHGRALSRLRCPQRCSLRRPPCAYKMSPKCHLYPGIIYLENSGAELTVRGRMRKFWGSPGSLAASEQRRLDTRGREQARFGRRCSKKQMCS